MSKDTVKNTEADSPARKRLGRKEHGLFKVLLSFLGSMELAISLFVVIGIASVIGTVLQQNQLYNNYIIKFGPFWFEVFKSLELFDIYSSWWFMLLLGFLLTSTSICLYHYTPVMLREWRRYRLSVTVRSLSLMHSSGRWLSTQPVDETVDFIKAKLTNGGYSCKFTEHQGQTTIAAKKGSINRLGYLFTHSSIVIICLGALYDGNFNLKISEMMGWLKPETRDIFASDVPAISRLRADQNHAFRGSVSLPEGQQTNIVFLQMRNGFLVQELPFSIELKDFRIEHYPSGQPKSFASDVVITDDQTKEQIAKTIMVNHPLIYRDFSIYQASFEDGGSELEMIVRPLNSDGQGPKNIKGTVGEDYVIETPEGDFTLELTEFNLFNIEPNPKAESTGHPFVNLGPRFNFRLRDSSGQAKEFQNYMNPIEKEGMSFFLSGFREAVSEPFQYLHIPADDNYSVERFFKFRAMLHNTDIIQAIAAKTARLSMPGEAEGGDSAMVKTIGIVMQRLVELFNQGGFDTVLADIKTRVPEEKQKQVTESYFNVLQTILGAVYLEVLAEEGVVVGETITAAQEQYFDNVVNTLGVIGNYHAPFYLQLRSFEHKQASGLQITRAPGKDIVYLGCILLVIGIILMFYVAHKRIWVILETKNGTTEFVIAGSGDRHQKEFINEFEALTQILNGPFKAL